MCLLSSPPATVTGVSNCSLGSSWVLDCCVSGRTARRHKNGYLQNQSARLKTVSASAPVAEGSSSITVRGYMASRSFQLSLHDVVPSASPVWARRRQSEVPRRRELTPWTAPFPARASAPAGGVAAEADAAAEAEREAAATAPAMEETVVRWSKMEEAACTKPGKWRVRVGRAPFARAESHSERDWEMAEAAAEVDAAVEPAGLEAEVEETPSAGRDHTEMEAEAPPRRQAPTLMRTRWKWYKALAHAAERGRQWSDRWLSPGPKRPPGARRVSQREVWGDRSEVSGDSPPGAQRVSQGAEPLPTPALCSQPQLGAAPPRPHQTHEQHLPHQQTHQPPALRRAVRHIRPRRRRLTEISLRLTIPRSRASPISMPSSAPDLPSSPRSGPSLPRPRHRD